MDKTKPLHVIVDCVERARDEVIKNSGFDYDMVEKKLGEIYGKTRNCLDSMKRGYSKAGKKADDNCPKA